MTRPKYGYNSSTTHLQTPICTSMVACDGDNLHGPSIERGYCSKCKKAMDKKAKAPKPLKGENTALSEATRRIDALKKGEE